MIGLEVPLRWELGEELPVKQRKQGMLEQTGSCWSLVALLHQEKWCH